MGGARGMRICGFDGLWHGGMEVMVAWALRADERGKGNEGRAERTETGEDGAEGGMRG